MKPFFSIIIPTLNEEKHLPTLLENLHRQSFTDFEVIIVDGQSEDSTLKKAQKFDKKFLKLTTITSQVRHVSHQRNLGALAAKADTLIFMDADDQVPVYFLQGIRYRFESTNCDIFTTWIEPDTKDTGSEAVATIINTWSNIQKDSDTPWVLEAMLVVKTSVFKKLKGFNEKTAANEGYDLAKRAIKSGFVYSVFKDPTYTFSLRRFRKLGVFKSISTAAQIEITRLSGGKLSVKKIRELYPMKGGRYFEIENNQQLISLLEKKFRLNKYRDKFIQAVRSILDI